MSRKNNNSAWLHKCQYYVHNIESYKNLNCGTRFLNMSDLRPRLSLMVGQTSGGLVPESFNTSTAMIRSWYQFCW